MNGALLTVRSHCAGPCPAVRLLGALGASLLLTAAVGCASQSGAQPATERAAAHRRATSSVASLPAQRIASDGPPPARHLQQLERLRDAFPAIRTQLREAVEQGAFPGLAAGVVLHDRLVWSGGFGRADREQGRGVTPRTVFRIASISKTFVGVALLMQRERKALRWDDPVARYVPEVARVIYPSGDSPRITLRHLVTHTAGIPRVDELDYAAQGGRGLTERQLLNRLDGLELERAPGTRARYSNLGAAVAATALGRMAEAPAATVIHERVLRPLGMKHTTWSARQVPAGSLATGYLQRADGSFRPARPWQLGAAAPIAGLYSNVEDMARFLSFQLAAWPPGAARHSGIVSPAALRGSHLVLGPAIPEQQAFGVFWMVDGDPTLGHVVHHSGSTGIYSATTWLLPQRGLGVVLLANTGNVASQRLDELARQVLLALLDADPDPALQLAQPVAAAVDVVKALLLEPSVDTIRRRFSARFLQSVPAEELAAFFERHRRTLGLCREHHVLRADADDAAVVRLYCAEGEIRVSVHVQRTSPHDIAGLILEAFPQRESTAP